MSFLDTGLTNGTTYYYVVTAIVGGQESAPSNEVYATPQGIPCCLNASAALGSVTLSWGNVPGAAGYNIKRGTTSGGPYTNIATVSTQPYQDTAVTNGTTYFYVVTAFAAGVESAPSTEASATPMLPSTQLFWANAGYRRVNLSWGFVTGATAYLVQRAATHGGPYATVATTSGSIYQDTGLTDGVTYYYVIVATNGATQSLRSNELAATPLLSPPYIFGFQPGNARVTISWSSAEGAVSYNIKRSTSKSGPFTTIANTIALSFVDGGVTNGTLYYYVVTSVAPEGESGPSSIQSAQPVGPPPAPMNLTAVAGDSQVTLTWNSVASATGGYRIYRGTTSGGPYSTVVYGVDSSVTSAVVSAPNGGPSYFVVTALNNIGGESPFSNEASATPVSVVPAAPVLSAISGSGVVKLTWNAISNANQYNVLRSTTHGGPYSLIGVVYPNAGTTFADVGVTNGTTYYYVVVAVGISATSPNSNEVSATPAVPPLPAAPTGLAATPGSGQVTLTWNPVPSATGYEVRRATVSGGPYTPVGSASSTSFLDVGLTSGTAYYYVVVAVDASGVSPNSTEVSATPL